MTVFEAVAIGVAVIGTAVAAIVYLRGPGALEQLGRQGQAWFEHSGDRAVSERPSEDERDAPLPAAASAGSRTNPPGIPRALMRRSTDRRSAGSTA
jgi:hypothetical protein